MSNKHTLPPNEKRCQASTQAGERCKAWVVKNEKYCSVHLGRNVGGGAPTGNKNAKKHGFYSQNFSDDELAALIAYAEDISLDDELAAARVVNARLLTYIMEERERLTPDQLARLTAVSLNGLKTVGNLLRLKQSVEGEGDGSIAGAIAMALDELGDELGITL